MKDALFLAGLFLCSFQTSSITIQEIFQEALLTKQLDEVFEKDPNGKLLPLTLVTNELISEEIRLKYAGKAVNIKQQNAVSTNSLELIGVKIKAKKSILEFKYQEKTIKIKLKKQEEGWRAYSLSIKSKGNLIITTVSRKEF